MAAQILRIGSSIEPSFLKIIYAKVTLSENAAPLRRISDAGRRITGILDDSPKWK